jgi:hypothetical protein
MLITWFLSLRLGEVVLGLGLQAKDRILPMTLQTLLH